MADLIGRLTFGEKIGQLTFESPAIERLGIPAHSWWNECLHGVALADVAAVFPQAIGLVATWDMGLLAEVATAVSDEARAKHLTEEPLHPFGHGLSYARFEYADLTFALHAWPRGKRPRSRSSSSTWGGREDEVAQL